MEAARVQDHPDIQDGLFDKVVEDELLGKALEKRQAAKDKKAKASADFKETDDVVKGKLDALDLEPGTVVRCGRFRISKSEPGAPVEVNFTRSPKPRLTISLLDE